MKLSISLLSLITLTFVRAEEESVKLDTYYNGELYPYLCSQSCKTDYEKYQPCFQLLDNEHIDDPVTELCKVYKLKECENFINDVFIRETACTNGKGQEDFDVHDEITMNKVFYLASCSTDAKGGTCTFSNEIQKGTYDQVTLYHMKEDVNKTLAESCGKKNCRNNLQYMLSLLVPLYEYDVKTDTELQYESEFIENDNRSIEFLKSETCVSQDPDKPNTPENITDNHSNTLKMISFVNLLFIFITAYYLN